MRKTKIVCTLGPSTDKREVLAKLIQEGLDVARFNFSHGSYEEHGKRLTMFKELREEFGKPLPALLDTKGPEVRIKQFAEVPVFLEKGQQFILTGDDVVGDQTKVSLTYSDLYKDVVVGTSILLDDGLVALEVQEVQGKDIICKVMNSGKVSNNKGVNVPDVELSLPDRKSVV